MISLYFATCAAIICRISNRFRSLHTNMQPKQVVRDYQGAIENLNSLQTNAQYIKNATTQPNAATNISEVTKFLKRTGLSVEALDKLSVIHITGTNGKGTTCAYCENILRQHGYKTGFYSSPHLLDVRERIRINGKPVSKEEFSKHFWTLFDLLNSQKDNPHDMPLYFRFLTLMAFHIFLINKVDVAILEVGIGGEYDCTNVIRKTIIAGVTPLDLDHTSLLGNSLESIAWNKSGIFKDGCIAFSTKQPEEVLSVFRDRSLERNCTLNIVDNKYFHSKGKSSIPIHVQRTNASLALSITEAFIKRDINNNVKFSIDLAKHCIEETRWPGRYEIKIINNMRFFLDGAHTLDSICVCTNWFKLNTLNSNKRKVLIFNLTGDRDVIIFFKQLYSCWFDTVIFTPNVGSDNDKPDSTDYILTEEKQLKKCENYKLVWENLENLTKKDSQKVLVFPSFSKAIDFLNDDEKIDVLVTGSLHLVGAALSVIDPTLSGTLTD